MQSSGGSRQRAPYAADRRRLPGGFTAKPIRPRAPIPARCDRIVHSTLSAASPIRRKCSCIMKATFSHAPDAHDRGGANRPRARPGAALDDDLAEAVALAHDLGHTPFGHTARKRSTPAWRRSRLRSQQPWPAPRDGAGAALRRFRRTQPDFRALEGWSSTTARARRQGGRWRVGARAAFPGDHGLRPAPPSRPFLFRKPGGAGRGDLDDIAYDAHDIDDGLRAGLFDLGAIRAVSFIGELLDEIDALHPGLERQRSSTNSDGGCHEVHRGCDRREARRIAAVQAIRSRTCARDAARRVLACDRAADADLKDFLFANMYSTPT